MDKSLVFLVGEESPDGRRSAELGLEKIPPRRAGHGATSGGFPLCHRMQAVIPIEQDSAMAPASPPSNHHFCRLMEIWLVIYFFLVYCGILQIPSLTGEDDRHCVARVCVSSM